MQLSGGALKKYMYCQVLSGSHVTAICPPYQTRKMAQIRKQDLCANTFALSNFFSGKDIFKPPPLAQVTISKSPPGSLMEVLAGWFLKIKVTEKY